MGNSVNRGGAPENASSSEHPQQEAFGRYALLEKIGQGGMAEVFRAKSYGVEGFEKVLVIKRILPQLARDHKFTEMFVREAKLSVRLSHANVVQVFDLGRVSDALFIAMEYVHGVDLATLLSWARRKGEPIAISTAAYIAAEVAKGLDHAHRRRDEQLRPLGIVHRDVSPQNVLVSYEGEVKVTDFGIAKALGTLAAESDDEKPRSDGRIQIRGKYAYLSPEQANGKPVDARSDIWALGVVLYEMLAGTNPFGAPTMFETLRRVRSAEAPPLELARPDVPREFAAIVKRALALEADERYPDAARLHDDLLAFLYTSGERFGAHALSELLQKFREGDGARAAGAGEPSQLGDAIDSAGVEEGLVRTPVEVPDAADLATAPPRVTAGAHVSHVEIGAGGLARAASLGEHREVTSLVLELGAVVEPPALGDRPSPTPAEEGAGRTASLRALAEGEKLIRRYGGQIADLDQSDTSPRASGRITAMFGLTEPDGRDTDLAVRCGLVVLRSLRELAPNSGIGIHAGRVTVDAGGEVVKDERLSALLVDARDLARIGEGRAAISTAALRHVRGAIDTESIPEASRPLASVSGVLVKGRKPVSELYGKFVGRREELRVLGEILAAATRRRARVVTIHGAPGTGKTRLLHEVQRRLQRGAYNVGWYLATCPPHGRDVPLAGVAAMLRVLCGLEEGDADAKVDAVRPRLRALGLGDDELRTVLDLARTGGDFHGGMEAAGRQEHAAAALAHMISRLCDDRLHVLAWDDMQAIDAASQAVLSSVARAIAACRVVMIFAGPEGEGVALSSPSGPSSDGRVVQQHLLVLQELGREEVQKVVGTRLGVKEIAPELLSFITARAGGNPLFVEELLRAMQDAGAIAKVTEPADPEKGKPAFERAVARKVAADPRADAGGGGAIFLAIDLPKSLRGLVASRLAKLSVKERAILTAIALLGEPAEIDIIAATAGEDLAALERILAPLERSGILRRGGERSVAFVSPVARDVCLDAAPVEAKRELHAAIASALVAQPNAGLDRIGHHLLEGGDRERAADYFARSGEALLTGGRADGAASDLMRALGVADLRNRSGEEVMRWLHGLATALGIARGGKGRGSSEAAMAIDRACTRIDVDGDARARRDALIDAGRCFGAVSLFDRAKDAFDRAEALAKEEKALRRVLMARVEMARRSGEFGEAAEILARLEPLVSAEKGNAAELYEVLVGLGSATAAVGGHGAKEKAIAYLDRAEAITARIGDDPARKVDRLKSRMLAFFFAKDFKHAAELCEKIIEIARDAGFHFELAIALHNLGDAKVRQGDHAPAYAALQQSLALAEEGAHERLSAINRAPIAYLDAIAGDGNAQLRLADIASWNRSRGYLWDELNARYWLGLLHVAKKDRLAAIEELNLARGLAQKLAMKSMATDCEEALQQALKITQQSR